MRKTYRYRLYPTKSQRKKLNRILELCRQVYNKVLETRKESWQQHQESIGKYDTIRMLPDWKLQKPELKEIHSYVLQDVCERVDLAFRAFFRRVKSDKKPGYPRFKGCNRYDSFTYPRNGFKLVKEDLWLSKIGLIKTKLHRPIGGKVKTLTIRRDKLGNWYACFSCIVKPKALPVSNEIVGIDLGLTIFAMLSTGEKIKRQRWAKQDEKDLKRVQRKLSKFEKGSFERNKTIRALNHIHTRIKNRRINFAHQESRKLVNRFGLIVFEDLNIQDMQSDGNRIINKSISDVAWNQFVRFTAYKAEEAGRGFVLVDPKNTSQKCSNCHQIVKKDLSVRIHDCPNCGLKIDRDLNAVRNILALGLQSIGSNP